MKNTGRIIILAALLIVAAGCTPRGIISKKKMSRIYYDMYMMDQYAQATPEYKRIADTCALYKFILADYGCTAEQFTSSVDYYLDRSKDMKDILEGTEMMLKAHEAGIQKALDKAAGKVEKRGTRRHASAADTLGGAEGSDVSE